MDRELFKKEFANLDYCYDKSEAMAKLKEIMNTDSDPTCDRYKHICIEEFSELIKEITKALRDKSDPYGMLEEVADAQICIWMLQQACWIDNDAVWRAITVKMKKAEQVVAENGTFK